MTEPATLVCSADELMPGDTIDAPGLTRRPIANVTYVAGGDRNPCYMVQVEWVDRPAKMLLLPALRVACFPGPDHVALHYQREADAAKGMPHSQRRTGQ